ncbi:hypothetical protein EDF60_1750 [Leucobacter luti]|nr:hypothetical protein EDF60_1750 [Leucobacter luti]
MSRTSESAYPCAPAYLAGIPPAPRAHRTPVRTSPRIAPGNRPPRNREIPDGCLILSRSSRLGSWWCACTLVRTGAHGALGWTHRALLANYAEMGVSAGAGAGLGVRIASAVITAPMSASALAPMKAAE